MTTTISGTAYITGDFLLSHATEGPGPGGTGFTYSAPEFVGNGAPTDFGFGGTDVIWTGHRWIGVVGGSTQNSGYRSNVLYSDSGLANTWTRITTLNTDSNWPQGISGIATDGADGIVIITGSRFGACSSPTSQLYYSTDDGNTWAGPTTATVTSTSTINYYAGRFMFTGACGTSTTRFASFRAAGDLTSTSNITYQDFGGTSLAIGGLAWNNSGNASQLLAVAGGETFNPYYDPGPSATSGYFYDNSLGNGGFTGTGTFSGGFRGRSVVYAWGNYWVTPAPGGTTIRTADPDTDIDAWTEIGLPFTISGGSPTLIYDATANIVIIPSTLTSNNANGYSYANSQGILANSWGFWESNASSGSALVMSGQLSMRTGNSQILSVLTGAYEYSTI